MEKAKGFRDFGIEVFTVEMSPSIQDGMKERAYKSLRIAKCHVPPTNLGELLMLSVFSLRAALRRYPSRPVGIYAYNQDVENLWIGYLLKVLLGAPLIVIYHQIRPASFQAFGTGVVDRTQRGFHPARAVQKSILPAINRFAARHADVNIALSRATKEDVKTYLGISECSVVGNGLNTVKFHPTDEKKSYEAVFLGRLAPQKGIDVLLKAWGEVIKTNPAYRLLLIGGGETEDVTHYKNMAEELRLGENVIFTGFLDDEEVVRLLNSSELFVFPSRKEGFAQAVSQAMGCGLCCILTDIPSLREVYGEAAVFVPVDQPHELARLVSDLLVADEERAIHSKMARSLAERFSWKETVRQELSLIVGPRNLETA